jgi:hypothetical protein
MISRNDEHLDQDGCKLIGHYDAGQVQGEYTFQANLPF